MSLRYFKEDYPELHVIAAGSLLEFILDELPSFAVGRIRSLYMYPFSFDEFLMAQGFDLAIDFKHKAGRDAPLPETAHKNLVEVDFVNKGGASEMFAGLEMLKYQDCFTKGELHYWQCQEKKSQAEVDYVVAHGGKVLPIEVKASTQGGMQSLWIFLRSHKLHNAVRTSLENFGQFYNYDKSADDAERHVEIVPLYALSNLPGLHLMED